MKLVYLLVILAFVCFVKAGDNLDYSYTSDNPLVPGPERWHEDFRYCGTGSSGEKQSPIDIQTAEFDPNLGFLTPNEYNNFARAKIYNDGHTIIIEDATLNGNNTSTLFVPGLMQETYILNHIEHRFALDDDDEFYQDTEHLIQGRSYDLEMQFVHYKQRYDDLQDAIDSRDSAAVAIVSVFFQRDGRRWHGELKRITDILPDIKWRNEEIIIENLDIDDFYPRITDYFTYSGSFSRPDCNEVVQWLVIRDPSRMSDEQLEEFRRILSDDDGTDPMGPNTRPVQPRNGRKVFKNFDEEDDDDYYTTFATSDAFSSWYDNIHSPSDIPSSFRSSDAATLVPFFTLLICILGFLFI